MTAWLAAALAIPRCVCMRDFRMNWSDIAIHAGISAVLTIVALLLGFPADWVFLGSFLFWVIREAIQHSDNPVEVFTRPQPLLEWVTPVAVTGIIIAIPLPVGNWLN
jgi:hypothetical protein